MRQGLLSSFSLSPLLTVAVSGSAFAASTQPVVESPLRTGLADAGVGLELRLDRATVAGLRNLQNVTLTDFALDDVRRVTLDLERAHIFSADAKIVVVDDLGEKQIAAPNLMIFSGSVFGDPNSRVFLSFDGDHAEGFVQTTDALYLLSSGSPTAPQTPRIYNANDAPDGLFDSSALSCAADLLPIPPRSHPGGHVTRGGAPCRVARIAIDSDWEYRQLLGGEANATAYVATLFGAVSEIFKRDINCRLEVSYLRIWNTSNDPWNQTDTVNQLFQFQDYWNANMAGEARNAAHFLSGRGLGGGVAYRPGLCIPGFDYGLSANLNGFFPYPIQNNSSQNWDLMVTSHELGHNFGAPHTHDMSPPVDGCAFGDCSVTPNGTIMSYCHLCSGGIANVRMEFHTRSINESMLPYLADPNTVNRCDLIESGPSVTDQPDSLNICEGSPAMFSVTASGSGNTYQWRHNMMPIGGATNATYSIGSVSTGDAGDYDVVITNSCGSTSSAVATLGVCVTGTLGDLNSDCDVDLEDLSVLLSNFGTMDGATYGQGDLSLDGDVDIEDLSLLLANYGAHC